MTRTTKRLVALLAAFAAFLILAPSSMAARAEDASSSFGHQKLRWQECAGARNPELRCAAINVPLDYRRPNARKIKLMISRLRATDPANRRGVLLSTYGGPGLSGGLFLPEDYAVEAAPQLRERFDFVGFDARFVEQSTPITCGRDQEEPEGFWNRAAPSREIFDAQVKEAHGYAEDCWRHAGWALPHATIENIARDMDIIRAVLGERRISFRGADGAGTAGAVYATLFPHRVDRFVLDSPINPDTLWRDTKMIRTRTFEDGFHAFAAWIAARNGRFRLGANAATVEATITDMWRRAPLTAGGRKWTSDELVYYTLLGVFFERFFDPMASNLAAIRAGNAAPVPIPLYPQARPGIEDVPADNHTAVSTAYQCADNRWPRDVEVYWRDVEVFTRLHPNFGFSHANIFPCAFWHEMADNRVALSHRTPPMLVTGAVINAIAPLDEVRKVAVQIKGARMVIDEHQSHELFPFFGSKCLKETVTAYLLSGRLPEVDVYCR